MTRTARFEMKESSKVVKLPEPYGKNLQILQRKPSWDEPVDMRILLDCRIVSIMQPPSSKTAFESYLDLHFSTFVPALLPILASQLAALLGQPYPGSITSQDALDREVLRLAKSFISKWR